VVVSEAQGRQPHLAVDEPLDFAELTRLVREPFRSRLAAAAAIDGPRPGSLLPWPPLAPVRRRPAAGHPRRPAAH
jgi:hypothetical protein